MRIILSDIFAVIAVLALLMGLYIQFGSKPVPPELGFCEYECHKANCDNDCPKKVRP